MPEITVLKVLLHCEGCVAKVKRHIRRLEGVESFHVDQQNSKVTVFGRVKPQVVLDKVLHAGKTAEFWPQPAQPLAAIETVGGKKKAAGEVAGGNAPKKQKSCGRGNEENREIIEVDEFGDENYDGGDGEIVNETDTIPALEVADESEEKVLVERTPKKKKESIRRKG